MEKTAPSSVSCDDNTNIAARSLLTLNSVSAKATPVQSKNSLPVEDSVVIPTQNNDLQIDVPVLTVCIDRSTGNPNVKIIKSKENDVQVSKEPKSENTDRITEESKMEVEEEIFGMVTAVIQKKPGISMNKYEATCKITGVCLEGKGDEIIVTGSWTAISTVRDLLQDLYKDNSIVNGNCTDGCETDHAEDDTEGSKDIGKNTVKDLDDMEEKTLSCSESKDTGKNTVKDLTPVYLCRFCGKILADDTELKEHYQKFHPDADTNKLPDRKVYGCSYCKKIFQNEKFLMLHIQEKHSPYVCTVCGKEFAVKRYLSMHMKRHSDENKKHTCVVCGWRFLERYKLCLHMESHKPKAEKNLPHTCKDCKRQFYNKAALDDHMNIHTGNRPFTCNICSSSFAHRIGLKRHLMTHSENKPFKCSICQKEFLFRAKLNEHFITHTGEGKYTCASCGKIFTTKASLKRHSQNCCNKIVSKIDSSLSGNVTETTSFEPTSSEAVYMCGICSVVFDTLEKASIHAASHEI